MMMMAVTGRHVGAAEVVSENEAAAPARARAQETSHPSAPHPASANSRGSRGGTEAGMAAAGVCLGVGGGAGVSGVLGGVGGCHALGGGGGVTAGDRIRAQPASQLNARLMRARREARSSSLDPAERSFALGGEGALLGEVFFWGGGLVLVEALARATY
jgi:hypothetical protein